MKKADIEKKINKMAEVLSEKLNKRVTARIRFNDWAKDGKNRTYINVTFYTKEKNFAYAAGFINNQTKRYNKGYEINLNGEGDFSIVITEMVKYFTPVTEEAAEEAAEEVIYKKDGKEYIIKKGERHFSKTVGRYRRVPTTEVVWRAIIRENEKDTPVVKYKYNTERWEAVMDMGEYFEEMGIPLTQEMKELGFIED